MHDFTRLFENLENGKNFVDLSTNETLLSITQDQAFRRPLSTGHSIVEVVQHIMNWRQFLMEKLMGNDEYEIEIDGPLDWRRMEGDSSAKWHEIRTTFFTQQEQLMRLIKNLSERHVERTVSNRNYNFRFLIDGVLQHDYYHFGQIRLLLKE